MELFISILTFSIYLDQHFTYVIVIGNKVKYVE